MSLSNVLEYYDSIHKDIKTFCTPLKDYYNIDLFGYFKIFYDSNNYITLLNDRNLTHHLLKSVEYNSIFGRKELTLNKSSVYKIVLWPKQPTHNAMDIYCYHSYWNGISLVKFNEKYLEIFFFASDKNDIHAENKYKKNIEMLINFADNFDFYILSRAPKVHETQLKHLKNGFSFTKLDKQIQSMANPTSSNIKPLIRVRGILIKIPPRAYQCLRLLAHGNTSKDIARVLIISYKTVEAHIANLKELTGYSRKSDLTKLYWDNTGYSVL